MGIDYQFDESERALPDTSRTTKSSNEQTGRLRPEKGLSGHLIESQENRRESVSAWSVILPQHWYSTTDRCCSPKDNYNDSE